MSQQELEKLAVTTRDNLRILLGPGSTAIVMVAAPPNVNGDAEYYVSFAGPAMASRGLVHVGADIVNRAGKVSNG